ncbi:hypothetical protein F5148DRAFT_1151024 [Russula earlei]|jgi:chromosome segregation ATPase|uniref:Uncharacterized protein n=1 Tax=Russula earlei TaxID=71964 RepID=A0ACC0U1X0_9AGAM|nr:hypothetical protein F5148DRAFT_1151024 [Russula earlei]
MARTKQTGRPPPPVLRWTYNQTRRIITHGQQCHVCRHLQFHLDDHKDDESMARAWEARDRAEAQPFQQRIDRLGEERDEAFKELTTLRQEFDGVLRELQGVQQDLDRLREAVDPAPTSASSSSRQRKRARLQTIASPQGPAEQDIIYIDCEPN